MLLELGSAYTEAQAQIRREQVNVKWLPENHVVYPYAEFICPACKQPVKSKITFLIDKRNKIVWRAFADGRELKFSTSNPSEHVHPHVYSHRSICMGYAQDGRVNQDVAAALFTGLNPESQVCDVGIWMRDVVGHKCVLFESVYRPDVDALYEELEPRRRAEWPGIYARALREMTEEELVEKGFADIPEHSHESWRMDYQKIKSGDWVMVDLRGTNYDEYFSGNPLYQLQQIAIVIDDHLGYLSISARDQMLHVFLPLLADTAAIPLTNITPLIRTEEPLPDLYPWGVGDVVKLTDAAIEGGHYKHWWRWNGVQPTEELLVLTVTRPGGLTRVRLLDKSLRPSGSPLTLPVSGQQLQLVRRG